ARIVTGAAPSLPIRVKAVTARGAWKKAKPYRLKCQQASIPAIAFVFPGKAKRASAVVQLATYTYRSAFASTRFFNVKAMIFTVKFRLILLMLPWVVSWKCRPLMVG